MNMKKREIQFTYISEGLGFIHIEPTKEKISVHHTYLVSSMFNTSDEGSDVNGNKVVNLPPVTGLNNPKLEL
jgi:hypothetical protein